MTDEIFEVLSDGYRRRLLLDLCERNPIFVSPDTQITTGGTNESETRIAKHHLHLPKLDAYGFIDWDSERQVVTKGPRFDEIRPVLELLDDHRDELPIDW